MKKIMTLVLLLSFTYAQAFGTDLVYRWKWEQFFVGVALAGAGAGVAWYSGNQLSNYSGPSAIVTVPLYLLTGFAGLTMIGIGTVTSVAHFELDFTDLEPPESQEKKSEEDRGEDSVPAEEPGAD